MNSTQLFFLIFIFILLVIALVALVHKNENFSQEIPTNCICVFDIDGTITCGLDRAAKAIARCKELGAKIAINTARPTKWYDDLNLAGLGLLESDFESDFYHGQPFNCSFVDIKCFQDSIATTKVNHLHTLSTKWNVNKQRIILFDDQWRNIEKARESGFSGIFANDQLCGLPDNVVTLIDDILIG